MVFNHIETWVFLVRGQMREERPLIAVVSKRGLRRQDMVSLSSTSTLQQLMPAPIKTRFR